MHTQKYHAVSSARDRRLHLKQEDNMQDQKEKQGEVLTGSSEDILFLFDRQLIAKSIPIIFNENYNDSTNFNVDKTKHAVYNQVPAYSQTDHPLVTHQRKLCREMRAILKQF